MSLLSYFNQLLLTLAANWFLTLPVLAFFVVAATMRLRQLRRLEKAEEYAMNRVEEESVLARRTLDFAHVGSAAQEEREEFHHMPSPEELAESAPSPGLPEPPPPPEVPPLPREEEADASADLSREPEPVEAPPPTESMPRATHPLLGEDEELDPLDPEVMSQVIAPSSPYSPEEQARKQEAIRTEILEGNRKALEDLSHLVDPKAIEETELGLAEDPDNLRLLDWLAMLYFANDRIDKAIDAYKKLISREPRSPDLFFLLGSCFFKVNLLPEAVWCWDRASDLNPPPKVQEQIDEVSTRARELIASWEARDIFQPITDRFVEFLVQDEEAPAWAPPQAPTPGSFPSPEEMEEAIEEAEDRAVEAMAEAAEAASSVHPPRPEGEAPHLLDPEEEEVDAPRAAPIALQAPPPEPADPEAVSPAGEDHPETVPTEEVFVDAGEKAADRAPEDTPPLPREPSSEQASEAGLSREEQAAEPIAEESSPQDPVEPGEDHEAPLRPRSPLAVMVPAPRSEPDPEPEPQPEPQPEPEPEAAAEPVVPPVPEPKPEPDPEPDPEPEPEATPEETAPEPDPEPPSPPDAPEEAAPPPSHASATPSGTATEPEASEVPPEEIFRVAEEMLSVVSLPPGDEVDSSAPRRSEVRFDEADALQAAFTDMFHTQEASREALVRSLRQLEDARLNGTPLVHPEYLEEPGGNVRIQTTYALAACSPEDLPTLLEAGDREIRFAAQCCLLAGEQRPALDHVLTALREEPRRPLPFLAELTLRPPEEDLAPHLLQGLVEEAFPPGTRSALWTLVLERCSPEEEVEILELLLAGGPEAHRALARFRGLDGLAELFPSLDEAGLREGFRAARALFAEGSRVPRSLHREIARGSGPETWSALLAEVQDQLLDVLDQDEPASLESVLSPALAPDYHLLRLLDQSAAPPPELLPLALAAFLRLWNLPFYQELEASLAESPEDWCEASGLERPDLLPSLRQAGSREAALEQAQGGEPGLFLLPWIRSLPSPSTKPLLARAALEHPELSVLDLATCMARLSSGGRDPLPLRDEPGYPEWYLARRHDEEEIRCLLERDASLAWVLFDRLGLVAAVPRLANFPRESEGAPGLKAFLENLSSGDVRGSEVAESKDVPEASESESRSHREPPADAPSEAPARPPRPRRKKRRKKKLPVGGGYTWSR